MTCWFARRRLMKMSSRELRNIENQALKVHVQSCPACDHLRELFISLDGDLIKGATPGISFDRQLNITLPPKSDYSKPLSTSMWRKLDWWLMPELTIKWSASLSVVIALGIISFNQTDSTQVNKQQLPNDLVISRGHFEITLEPEVGLHLMSRATNSSNIGSSENQKQSVANVVEGSI